MKLIPYLLCLFCTCLASCAGQNASFAEQQQSQQDFLKGLRDARFKGSAYFHGSGSPLSFNADTSWSLGPKCQYGFTGEVDFTQLPIGMPNDTTKPEIVEPGAITAPSVSP